VCPRGVRRACNGKKGANKVAAKNAGRLLSRTVGLDTRTASSRNLAGKPSKVTKVRLGDFGSYRGGKKKKARLTARTAPPIL